MIEQTLRTFGESRHRRLIVTAGTFIVGLVLVVPLVDAYRTERDEKTALLEELASAKNAAELIGQFETNATAQTTELNALEVRTVNADTLPALRTKLVDLARDTGCSLRRLNVGTMSTRPWYQGDNSIATGVNAAPKSPDAKTAFNLEWWPVTLSISGTSASLSNLVDRMEADGMFMHTKTFEMHPASMGRKMLDLDMEVWYFNLARSG